MRLRHVVSLLICAAGLLLTFAKANAAGLPADYRAKAKAALGIPPHPNAGSVITIYRPAYAALQDEPPRDGCVWAVRIDYTLADAQGLLPFSTTIGVVIFRDDGATEVVELGRVRWLFSEPKRESNETSH